MGTRSSQEAYITDEGIELSILGMEGARIPMDSKHESVDQELSPRAQVFPLFKQA